MYEQCKGIVLFSDQRIILFRHCAVLSSLGNRLKTLGRLHQEWLKNQRGPCTATNAAGLETSKARCSRGKPEMHQKAKKTVRDICLHSSFQWLAELKFRIFRIFRFFLMFRMFKKRTERTERTRTWNPIEIRFFPKKSLDKKSPGCTLAVASAPGAMPWARGMSRFSRESDWLTMATSHRIHGAGIYTNIKGVYWW